MPQYQVTVRETVEYEVTIDTDELPDLPDDVEPKDEDAMRAWLQADDFDSLCDLLDPTTQSVIERSVTEVDKVAR